MNSETCRIALEGRIDSGNAREWETRIMTDARNAEGADICLDAGKLSYISSAGLRVLLRLAKETASLHITNVSSAVYEVFEMTGLSEVFAIER